MIFSSILITITITSFFLNYLSAAQLKYASRFYAQFQALWSRYGVTLLHGLMFCCAILCVPLHIFDCLLFHLIQIYFKIDDANRLCHQRVCLYISIDATGMGCVCFASMQFDKRLSTFIFFIFVLYNGFFVCIRVFFQMCNCDTYTWPNGRFNELYHCLFLVFYPLFSFLYCYYSCLSMQLAIFYYYRVGWLIDITFRCWCCCLFILYVYLFTRIHLFICLLCLFVLAKAS